MLMINYLLAHGERPVSCYVYEAATTYEAPCKGACLSNFDSDNNVFALTSAAMLLTEAQLREKFDKDLRTRKFCWSNGNAKVSLPRTPCVENCRPMPCPNARVCGEFENPQWILDCHDGACWNCNMYFSKWQVNGKENCEPDANRLKFVKMHEPCPICFDENQEGVELKGCTHQICETCFIGIVKFKTVNKEGPVGCPLCRAPFIL